MSAHSLRLRHERLIHADRLSWCDDTNPQIDTLLVPNSPFGSAIDEFAVSPSGNWIVTFRCSGAGEWGYDVIRSHPLERMAGIDEQKGYMLDIPQFSEDEAVILGGYGERWLGGWWGHPDDDPYDTPARGGSVHVGWLFQHALPSQAVTWHELRMTLPAGWFPDDPDAEQWMGPRSITPTESGGVHMILPGKIPLQFRGPLPERIDLPAPHPNGGSLL